MKKARARIAFVLAGGLLAAGLLAQDVRREEANGPTAGRGIANWAAPAFWSPGETAQVEGNGATLRDKATPALTTSPVPFIGITPCRIVDTRNASYPAGYGPPQLSAGVPRSFTLTGQCGIPDGAQAVSLNVTVVSPTGLGYVLLYPAGGSQPNVSTLNFTTGQTVANAAIVPLGAGGGIAVSAALSSTELLIDTNGYYAGAGVGGGGNTFLGNGAGNFTMTGSLNTAIGYHVFQSNDTGAGNAAIGDEALFSNTTGRFNTAIGEQAMYYNISGSRNTATGDAALFNSALGSGNTVYGDNALFFCLDCSGNTVVGLGALYSFTAGTDNIAIGNGAGTNVLGGDRNIYLGNAGPFGNEYGVMRLGRDDQNWAVIYGVRGVTTSHADAVPVVIDSAGQLGTISSSARYKDDIEDMAEASSGLLKLRPVTFRYKGQPQGSKQFGLIAEEVEEVMPELVVRNAAGEVETVLYHQMPAMLLNELQKQQRTIEQQAEANARQDAEIVAQRERIGELLGALEAMQAQIRAIMEGRQGR